MSDLGRTPVSGDEVAAHEVKMLEHVVRSMRVRYPGVPARVITEKMVGIHRRYAGARIRDFVPLLVERELVTELDLVSPDDLPK